MERKKNYWCFISVIGIQLFLLLIKKKAEIKPKITFSSLINLFPFFSSPVDEYLFLLSLLWSNLFEYYSNRCYYFILVHKTDVISKSYIFSYNPWLFPSLFSLSHIFISPFLIHHAIRLQEKNSLKIINSVFPARILNLCKQLTFRCLPMVEIQLTDHQY